MAHTDTFELSVGVTMTCHAIPRCDRLRDCLLPYSIAPPIATTSYDDNGTLRSYVSSSDVASIRPATSIIHHASLRSVSAQLQSLRPGLTLVSLSAQLPAAVSLNPIGSSQLDTSKMPFGSQRGNEL